MRKILFLDFDGVITTLESKWRLCPKKLQLLGQILEQTNAELVISSSWRRGDVKQTIEMLKDTTRYFNNGIEFPFCDKIIGVTKKLLSERFLQRLIRGEEIKSWLKENTKEEVYTYCILDDDTDMLEEQLPYFINTDWETGLSDNDVERAIKILNGK